MGKKEHKDGKSKKATRLNRELYYRQVLNARGLLELEINLNEIDSTTEQSTIRKGIFEETLAYLDISQPNVDPYHVTIRVPDGSRKKVLKLLRAQLDPLHDTTETDVLSEIKERAENPSLDTAAIFHIPQAPTAPAQPQGRVVEEPTLTAATLLHAVFASEAANNWCIKATDIEAATDQLLGFHKQLARLINPQQSAIGKNVPTREAIIASLQSNEGELSANIRSYVEQQIHQVSDISLSHKVDVHPPGASLIVLGGQNHEKSYDAKRAEALAKVIGMLLDYKGVTHSGKYVHLKGAELVPLFTSLGANESVKLG